MKKYPFCWRHKSLDPEPDPQWAKRLDPNPTWKPIRIRNTSLLPPISLSILLAGRQHPMLQPGLLQRRAAGSAQRQRSAKQLLPPTNRKSGRPALRRNHSHRRTNASPPVTQQTPNLHSLCCLEKVRHIFL